MDYTFPYEHFIDLLVVTARFIFKMQLDGLLQIADGFLNGITKAGNIDIEALGHVIRGFFINTKFDLPHNQTLACTSTISKPPFLKTTTMTDIWEVGYATIFPRKPNVK